EEAGSDAYALRVRRWDGASWIDLESRVSAVRREVFDLGVDSAGRVLVAERTPESVNVVRYEDSAWVALGEWSATPQIDYLLEMALDDADRPTILDNDAGLRVRRWTSSAWEELGLPGAITPAGAQRAALALRPSGDPVVAWINGSSVWLKQWEGSSWEELEGSATGAGVGTSDGQEVELGIALGIDATDRFVVAWSGQYRVWDGNTWSSTGKAGGNRPRLARSSEGTLYLLTDGDTLRERLLYRWQADTWEPLTELLAEYNEEVDLAVARDGRLGVASGYDYVRYGDYAEDGWSEQQTVAGAEALLSQGVLQAGPALISGCVASMWNGASWDVVTAPTRAKDCAFGRNADGVVHIAFWTHDNDEIDTGWSILDLRVARLTADGWFLLGDLNVVNSADGLVSSSTELGFDAEGNPIVAWMLEDDAAWGGAARWTGSEWMHWDRPQLGDAPENWRLAVTHDSRPVLSLDDHDLTVQQRRVIEWTGETWHASIVASRDRRTGPPFPIARLVVDAAGDPVLIGISDSGPAVVKQVGSEWKQVAPTEEVLEDLPPESRVAAWSEGGDAFAQYFSDCSWHGLSSSNYGGGVSNSVANSTAAQVAASESKVCVAWTEQIDAGDRVLLRCHGW
ncbi:MAG TPA: hypothetical protein VFU02_19255, partial [Polyangiaceae bacterium]|nr:hypothetical protein [Polyangiaceae bacterium]